MFSEFDIRKLIELCDSILELQHAKLGDEYFYQSLPLCVIDAVYSIGVRYEGTRNTVMKYCRYYDLQRIRSDREHIPSIELQESILGFIDKMESCGIEYCTNTVFNNRQRTSATNGILKSSAVLRFAKTLQKYNVNYIQDVQSLIVNDDFENDIRRIPGQNSGISLKYFFMLAGSDNLVKPDRWIKSFIKNVTKRQVNDHEAQQLLSGTCEELKKKYFNLTLRLLDNLIWNYERNKAEKSEKRQARRELLFANTPDSIYQPKTITGKSSSELPYGENIVDGSQSTEISSEPPKKEFKKPIVINSPGFEKFTSKFHDKLKEVMRPYKKNVMQTARIKKIIETVPNFYGQEQWIYASDHCINHTNKGACRCALTENAIFEQISRGKYRIL